MTLRQIINRILGRDGRAEADVPPDPARVDSRKGPFVGRMAGDEDFSDESGAERRARSG